MSKNLAHGEKTRFQDLLPQFRQHRPVLLVDPLQGLQQGSFRVLLCLRRDDDVLPVCGDLKRSIHAHFEQVQQSLIEDQSSTVSVLDKLLCHRLKVYTRCIRCQVRRLVDRQTG